MFLSVLIGCFSVALAKDLPSNFPRCHVDDPKINQCFLEATKTVKPYLIKGVPQLPFPSIAPFFIPQVDLEQQTSVLKYKATLTNVKIFGFEDYEFSKFDYNPATLEYQLTVGFKSIKVEGDYGIDGTILSTAVKGNGKFTASAGQTTAVLHIVAEFVNRKGEDYSQIKNIKATVTADNPKLKLDGLFGGDSALSNAVNEIIDQNIDALFKEFLPEVEKVVEEIFRQLLGNIFKDIPNSKLLPRLNA